MTATNRETFPNSPLPTTGNSWYKLAQDGGSPGDEGLPPSTRHGCARVPLTVETEECALPDPLRHPDLVRLGRTLRDQLDETLDAEQHAARAAARRRRTLRDALLTGEDRGQLAKISCLDGQLYRGVVEAVGADHVVLRDGDVERSVALAHIVALDLD